MCHPAHFEAPAALALPASASLAPSPAVPSPLPPIPSQDRPLLTRLFALHENYPALAAELSATASTAQPGTPTDLLDLYAWSTRPEIAAWIAHYRSMTDLQRRTLALTTLEEVIKSSPAPTERRRAATTLLRALDHNWPARSASGRPGYPAPPGRESLSLSRSVPASSRHSPPPPRSKPTPSPDPTPALTAIREALATPQAPIALSTLHAHAAPDAPQPATFAGHPIPESAADFIAELPKLLPAGFRFPLTLSGGAEKERTDTRLIRTAWLRNTSGDSFYCSLTLIRDGPDHPAPCWRLAALDILRRQSD